MRLGIMQPYFFPYIGYFQLISAVNQFIIYDDVQWIKGGWINRNRILLHGQPHFVTLPVNKNSLSDHINERFFSKDIEKQKNKVFRTIDSAYRKAPYFNEVIDVIEACLSDKQSKVSDFLVNTLLTVCDYLEINTPLKLSSQLEKNNALKGQEQIIEINRVMGSKEYINPIGGTDLYDHETFSRAGLTLKFLKPGDVRYQQFEPQDFSPSLSIIDVMMFNPKSRIRELLNLYELID